MKTMIITVTCACCGSVGNKRQGVSYCFSPLYFVKEPFLSPPQDCATPFPVALAEIKA